MPVHLPNWLIVYGTNRNSGKTTLITKIIRHFHDKVPVAGLKISPHFHPLEDDEIIVEKCEEYVITRESRTGTGKDSSRMLAAGAREVYYVQVWDNNLAGVLPRIIELTGPASAVICESGWARNLVVPGVFLILHRKGGTDIKESTKVFKPLADRWIEFDGSGFDFNIEQLDYCGGKWELVR